MKSLRRWLDRKRGIYRTTSGKVLRHDDIEKLADEAERGYDVSAITPRRKS